MWVTLNQDEDEFEKLVVLDRYVDYHAVLVHPEAAKVIRELQEDVPTEGFGPVKIVNPTFEKKKEQAIRGEAFVPKQNADMIERVREIRKKLAQAKEGFEDIEQYQGGN